MKTPLKGGRMVAHLTIGFLALFVGVMAISTKRISRDSYQVAEGWQAVGCGLIWLLIGINFLVPCFRAKREDDERSEIKLVPVKSPRQALGKALLIAVFGMSFPSWVLTWPNYGAYNSRETFGFFFDHSAIFAAFAVASALAIVALTLSENREFREFCKR